jgi:hypothetical protein
MKITQQNCQLLITTLIEDLSGLEYETCSQTNTLLSKMFTRSLPHPFSLFLNLPLIYGTHFSDPQYEEKNKGKVVPVLN